jgi:hypothetical protein
MSNTSCQTFPGSCRFDHRHPHLPTLMAFYVYRRIKVTSVGATA